MKTGNSITECGFVLVELVIAIALFGLVITTAIPAFEEQVQYLSRLTSYSHSALKSFSILQKTIAYDQAIPGQSSIVAITPCLNEALATSAGASLEALYVPPLALAAAGNDCGGYMSPESLFLPFSASASASIAAQEMALDSTTTMPKISFSSFDFWNGYAYAGASSTDGYGLFIINPVSVAPIVSRLQLPPISDIDIANKYAYIASAASTSQLEVVDVHNPIKPQIVATRTLPGVAGSFPGGLSIRYYAGRVYLGTHRTAGNELHIFDVTAPSNPRWLGSIELNHNINDIVVAGNYAYLATSGNTSDVIILNVADPTHPVKISSLTFPGTEDTEKAFLLGSTLYLGRLKGIAASHPELVAVNVADPSAPFIIATSSLAATVTGLRAIAGELMVATNIGILSLAINPDATSSASFFSSLQKAYPQAALGLDYENEAVFSLNSASSSILTLRHLP